MSESVTHREKGHDYVASVSDARDLGSPVVVTSGKYTVRFDGNDFATKHLRRIRRGSVSSLTSGDVAGKLSEYMDDSWAKAVSRFSGNNQATSTLIFLDLGQYCQFGCQVIKFLAADRGAWTVFGQGAGACWQKHTAITIEKCFASSNDGFGKIKPDANDAERLQHGIGITFTVTVKQPVGGNGLDVQVCHYAGGGVTHEFAPESTSAGPSKLKAIGKSIVS